MARIIKGPETIHGEFKQLRGSAEKIDERRLRRLHEEARDAVAKQPARYVKFALNVLNQRGSATPDIASQIDAEYLDSPAFRAGVVALHQQNVRGIDAPPSSTPTTERKPIKTISIAERAKFETLPGDKRAFTVILDDMDSFRVTGKHDNSAMGKVLFELGLDGGPNGGKVMSGPEAIRTLEFGLQVLERRIRAHVATSEENLIYERIKGVIKARLADTFTASIRTAAARRHRIIDEAELPASVDKEFERLVKEREISVYNEFCRFAAKSSKSTDIAEDNPRAGLLEEWRQRHSKREDEDGNVLYAGDPRPTKQQLIDAGRIHGYDLPKELQGTVTEGDPASQAAAASSEAIANKGSSFTHEELAGLLSMVYVHGNEGGYQIVIGDANPISFIISKEQVNVKNLWDLLSEFNGRSDTLRGNLPGVRTGAVAKLALVLANDPNLYGQVTDNLREGTPEEINASFKENVQTLLRYLYDIAHAMGEDNPRGGIYLLGEFLKSEDVDISHTLAQDGSKSTPMIGEIKINKVWRPTHGMIAEAKRLRAETQ